MDGVRDDSDGVRNRPCYYLSSDKDKGYQNHDYQPLVVLGVVLLARWFVELFQIALLYQRLHILYCCFISHESTSNLMKSLKRQHYDWNAASNLIFA